MAGWSVEATFFLLAALIQLLLGLTIVLRRARVEWAAVLGLLFCFNGALSVNALLVHLGVYAGSEGYAFRDPGSRVFFVFDRLTNLLIAYLALAYPRRPAWAASRPWLLPSAFGALALTVLVPFQLGAQYVQPLEPDCPLSCNAPTWFSLWTQVGLSLGVPLLLVRWAWLLPRSESPLALTHLKLLLGVFALRLVNVETVFQVSKLAELAAGHDPANIAWWLGLARALVSALALAAFGVLLLRARRGPSEVAEAADVVLAFAVVGVAVAVVTRTLDLLGGGFPYFYGPLLQVDFLVVRPAVVLYAIVRHDLLGPFFLGQRSKLAVSATLAMAMAFTGIAVPLVNTPAPSLAAYASAALVALVVAAAATTRLRPLLRQARRGPGMPSAAAVGAYIASLEEAHRNEAPTDADRARLAEDRRRLGIGERQARMLEDAVRGRWAGTVGAQDWRPGETLAGRYLLEERLGEGGTAEAYRATDLVRSEPVVLKRTRQLDPAGRKALVREAFHLARLDHPNIVRLLRTEALGDEPILVLEFLEGGSLRDRLARGPLAGVDAQRLAVEVLQGLSAAHEAGVVHGDVKPANILFTRDGRAKLADFGVARSPHVPAALVDMTRTGAAAPGSLRYMSPEQVQGLPADARSDLFSLGLVLAEALGGEPFPGQPATDYELRRAIVEGPAPRLGRAVPQRLARAVRQATERPAERRPPSADRMLALLQGQ